MQPSYYLRPVAAPLVSVKCTCLTRPWHYSICLPTGARASSWMPCRRRNPGLLDLAVLTEIPRFQFQFIDTPNRLDVLWFSEVLTCDHCRRPNLTVFSSKCATILWMWCCFVQPGSMRVLSQFAASASSSTLPMHSCHVEVSLGVNHGRVAIMAAAGGKNWPTKRGS